MAYKSLDISGKSRFETVYGILSKETVKWECQVEVLFEPPLCEATQAKQLDVESGRGFNGSMRLAMFGMEKNGFPRHNISITPWPDVLQFRKLWFGFLESALTHQEDSLRAFSAIISTFSPDSLKGLYSRSLSSSLTPQLRGVTADELARECLCFPPGLGSAGKECLKWIDGIQPLGLDFVPSVSP